MQRVTSRHNPRLREAARLIASTRERRKQHRCVIEGEHLINVYEARHGTPDVLVVNEQALARDGVRAIALEHPSRTLVIPASMFAELAALPADVGILAVVPTPQPELNQDADFCLLLDDLQD